MSANRGPAGDIQKKVELIEREVREHVADKGRLAVIQAPPGSGKTWLLLKTVEAAFKLGRRIAIATQTKAQADDICRRFARDYPKLHIIRFASGRTSQEDLGKSVEWKTETKELPTGKCMTSSSTSRPRNA